MSPKVPFWRHCTEGVDVGLDARSAPLAWALLGWVVLIGLFGPLLGLPEAAVRLSPFGWVPAVPAEELDVVPLLGLLAVAGALSLLALTAFRRRDLLG
jgi:ABC-2 type transport system permease protein